MFCTVFLSLLEFVRERFGGKGGGVVCITKRNRKASNSGWGEYSMCFNFWTNLFVPRIAYQPSIYPFCRVRHIGSKVPGHIRSSRRCCIEQENNHIPAFLFGHHGEKQGASRPVGIVGTAGKNDQDTIAHKGSFLASRFGPQMAPT